MSADVYYYEVPRTWADDVREHAATLAIRCMRFTDWLAKWEWLDALRWWIEGVLESLFSAWFEGSPEELEMVINGEIPLHGVCDRLRSRIVGFDDTEWQCLHCCGVCCAWEAVNDHCPDCGENGSLYLGRSFPDPEPESEQQERLLLTERRAA